MARLAVSLPCNAAADGQATFWLGVIAFGKQADALAKHQKGDLVSVAGNMQINQWTGGMAAPSRVTGTGRQRDQRQNGTPRREAGRVSQSKRSQQGPRNAIRAGMGAI